MILKQNLLLTENTHSGSNFIKNKALILSATILIAVACIIPIINSFASFTDPNIANLKAADFRTDINKLMEAGLVIEASKYNLNLTTGLFGSVGKSLAEDEIKPPLRSALLKIADSNHDGRLSDNELDSLGVKKINKAIYKDELNRLSYSLMTDSDLGNYLIITKGDLSGTVLYNGDQDFTDASRKKFLSLSLYIDG
ncbi:MAG TPA: hypothetical protein VF941_07780 [Clostridia bacterium]